MEYRVVAQQPFIVWHFATHAIIKYINAARYIDIPKKNHCNSTVYIKMLFKSDEKQTEKKAEQIRNKARKM